MEPSQGWSSELAESEGSKSEESDENDAVPGNEEANDDEVEDDIIEYDDIELDASVAPVTLNELMDDDTELWLVRIPKHDILMNGLIGKSMTVDDSTENLRFKGANIGTFKGSYHFRDNGKAGAQHARAAFVLGNDDPTKSSSLQFGKWGT